MNLWVAHTEEFLDQLVDLERTGFRVIGHDTSVNHFNKSKCTNFMALRVFARSSWDTFDGDVTIAGRCKLPYK